MKRRGIINRKKYMETRKSETSGRSRRIIFKRREAGGAVQSTATFAISASTMIFTSSSKVVFDGFQPNLAFAFVGSPQRFTTSVGR